MRMIRVETSVFPVGENVVVLGNVNVDVSLAQSPVYTSSELLARPTSNLMACYLPCTHVPTPTQWKLIFVEGCFL